MPSVRHEVQISRPRAAVFAFLSDFANDTRWRANVTEMRALASEDAIGGRWSRQVEVRRVPGRVVETEAVITQFEPPNRLAVQRATGPVRPQAIYTLAEDGAQHTMVAFELRVDLVGIAVLLWPVVQLGLWLVVRPALAPDLSRLKRLLEST